MRPVLKNRTQLKKLKQPLPLFCIEVAKKWAKKKSAFEPIVVLPTRKKLKNIEDWSLEAVKIGVYVGGKKGTDYNYQSLPEIIEAEVKSWEALEYDGKQIKLKKDESK